MNRWRLIALDMDGTTLTKDGSISDANRAGIQAAQEAGVAVTFATGRPLRGVVRTFMEDLEFRAPVVTLNGGEVWTADGELLARYPFPLEDVEYLHALARRCGLSYWGATTEQMVGMDAFPDSLAGATWLKFGMYGKDPDLIRQVWTELKADQRYEISNSHALNIEVNPFGVSKAKGLQIVCDYLGIEAHQVVTIGDGMNDVAMLRWAGLGIAMGNAQSAVQDAADVTTAHFEANGVAEAIQKYVLAQADLHITGI